MMNYQKIMKVTKNLLEYLKRMGHLKMTTIVMYFYNRLAVTSFTQCKNGSKVPVTRGNQAITIYLLVKTQFTDWDF